MKYKQGDEVFIKADITDVSDCSERPYFVAPDIYSVNWVSEDKIIQIGKTYSDGLSDAWELAKKIVMGVEDGGFDSQEVIDVFGKSRYYSFKDFTAEEAIAKLEAYEKEKEIKVKTIVETNDGSHKGVVTRVRDKGDFFVLWDNGTSDTYEKHEVKNTGKTAESLDLLLRQIGE